MPQNRFVNVLRPAVSILLLLVGSTLLAAGPAGTIAGRVLDADTRTPLAGANVVVRGAEAGSATARDGSYCISGVPAGTYAVEASYLGYRTQVRSGVTVRPDQTTELVFRLVPSTIELPTVRVHADYFPKQKDAPVSGTSFSTEEVQTQPGGIGDIQRVVQSLPGVVSSGDQDNQVIVRGGAPNENLFLVDGIEIPHPNHFGLYDGQGGITMLNPLLIRDVDFITGAFPARYGDRASSVMDITLRNGSTTGVEGNVDLGLFGIGAVVEGPIPATRGSFLGAYHKSFAEILAKVNVYGGSAVPYYDDWLAKLNFKPGAGHDLSLLFAFGDDHINIQPGELGDEISIINQKTSRTIAGASWQTLFGTIGYGRLLLSGVRADFATIEMIDTAGLDTTFSANAREDFLTARYEATLRWLPGQETQAGVSFSYTPFSHRMFIAPETLYYYEYNPDSSIRARHPLPDSETGLPRVITADIRSSFSARKCAAYLQHGVRLGNLVHLNAGVRYDRFDFTGWDGISPRIGIATEPLFAGLSFGLGYGWHYQAPPVWILSRDPANYRLRSQRSDHIVARVERRITDDSRTSVEFYHKRIANVLIPRAWTTADPYDKDEIWLDSGKGRAQGIEFFYQKRNARNWYGALSCSFSRSRLDNPLEPGKELPGEYDYGQVISAMGAYTFEFGRHRWYQQLPGWFRYTLGALVLSDEATLGFRFRYLGGRPYTPEDWIVETRHWVANDSLLMSARYPAYHRLDVRWDHKFIFNRWNLAWYVEVQNVYDRANVWQYHYCDSGSMDPIYQFRFFPVGGLVVGF